MSHLTPENFPPSQPGAPQQWAWVRPQPQYEAVQTEPLEYHRLYRGAPKYRWWKPLLVLLLAASIYVAFNLTFSLLLGPLLFIYDPDYVNNALFAGDAPLLDTQHPWSLVLGLGSIILMIPAVILAMLSLGIRPVGRVWSVAGRIRWGFLGRTLGLAVVAIIAMNAVGILVGMALSGADEAGAEEALENFDPTAAIISLVLVLLLVPFQAAAEEVVFRGLFLQVLGSWMRSPWLAVGLSSLAFALMHIYDIWGMLAVGLMGLVAAWLTWKTGGLEAAIAIHILNNIAAFALMASGVGGETAQVEESGNGPWLLVSEVVGLAIFSWLVLRSFRKHGYGRERIDIVYREVPQEPQSPMQVPVGAQSQYGAQSQVGAQPQYGAQMPVGAQPPQGPPVVPVQPDPPTQPPAPVNPPTDSEQGRA